MSTDRNLLFGVLALQMDFLTRDQLVAGMNAWILEKAKPLGQVLVEQGALRDTQRVVLESLIEEHIRQHGNDPAQSLAALSSVESVREALEQVGDFDVQASLGHLKAATTDQGNDPYATQP